MNEQSQDQLLDLLEELGAIQGVRGALIATSDGALAAGQRSGLSPVVANDVAKTVRRMTVASSTVGVPLEELLINFGPARMMVIPLREDGTLVVLLERDTAVSPVRSLLKVQLTELRDLLESATQEEVVPPAATGADDEIERLLQGELGPVLAQIQQRFAYYLTVSGRGQDEAAQLMREQMREWLLCCNPSPYTFPLLIDGLGQLLNDTPGERGEFMTEVQETIRNVQGMGDKAAR